MEGLFVVDGPQQRHGPATHDGSQHKCMVLAYLGSVEGEDKRFFTVVANHLSNHSLHGQSGLHALVGDEPPRFQRNWTRKFYFTDTVPPG